MSSTLLFELTDGIARVTVNRPDKLNALNAIVIAELGDAVTRIETDSAVRGVIITGGFAPVLHETEEICTRLFNHVATRNADYYARFPDDAACVRRIVDHLETTQDIDGHGQRLSARRFLMLGAMLGPTCARHDELTRARRARQHPAVAVDEDAFRFVGPDVNTESGVHSG